MFGERQRHRVEAMALARRRRAIGKNVAQVATATRAHLLHSDHSIAGVAKTTDMRLIVGPEEARPTGARVEFRAGPEKRQPAEAAGINPFLVVVQEHTAERRFRAVLE